MAWNVIWVLAIYFLALNTANGQLLWRVSGNNLEKPSYLFGTLHLGVELEDFEETLTKCIDSSDVVATELNTDSIDMMQFMSLMVLPNDVSYKDYLNDTQYQKLDSLLKKSYGLGLAIFGRLQPVITSMMVSLDMGSLDSMKSSNGAPKSLDVEIRTYARKSKKELAALETAKGQLDALTSISIEEQFTMLVSAMEMPSDGLNSLKSVEELYRKQDIEGMVTAFDEEDYDPMWSEGLLDKRNVEMVNTILTQIHFKSLFVAVGAAHLGGEKGLVNLLKQNGYAVHPVALKFK